MPLFLPTARLVSALNDWLNQRVGHRVILWSHRYSSPNMPDLPLTLCDNWLNRRLSSFFFNDGDTWWIYEWIVTVNDSTNEITYYLLRSVSGHDASLCEELVHFHLRCFSDVLPLLPTCVQVNVTSSAEMEASAWEETSANVAKDFMGIFAPRVRLQTWLIHHITLHGTTCLLIDTQTHPYTHTVFALVS